MKVHYIGFSHDEDEWRNCDELMGNGNLGRIVPRFSPSQVSLQDRGSLVCDRLKRKIKHALFSSKRESPEVRLEEPIELDVYDNVFKHIGLVKKDKGRSVHCVNSVLDPNLCKVLGDKWFERILNKNGDFAYVTKGTIQFWLHVKAAIKEFVDIGDKLFENYIENDMFLIFTFVRGDGVKIEYKTGQWKY